MSAFLLVFQKITWVVLTKSQLLLFEVIFGLKICADDIKKIKFKVTKFEMPGHFNGDFIDKRTRKWRNHPPARIGLMSWAPGKNKF